MYTCFNDEGSLGQCTALWGLPAFKPSFRTDEAFQAPDLLIGSLPDFIQLSDEGVDLQRPFQLLLVAAQVHMELAPPDWR